MASLFDTQIIAAPMAGGPSTPELVRAVGRAGAFGFLAAGYKTPEALAAEIARVRQADVPFGVNVFVPESRSVVDTAALEEYRRLLMPVAQELGVEPGEPRGTDDGWSAKVQMLLEDPVPVVSFTFGLAPPAVVEALQVAGTRVLATVTTPKDARKAAATGVDGLVVQGPEAGGHQATFDAWAPCNDWPLVDLIDSVMSTTDLPVVAAGGLGTREDVRAVLDAGAVAAQCGTAFLLADEAGTSPAHRAALVDPRFARTSMTRAFSGRWARGLHNAFMDRFTADAPAAYPHVNAITGPLRKAAAAQSKPEYVHLWAGSGWRAARAAPAKEIVAALETHGGES